MDLVIPHPKHGILKKRRNGQIVSSLSTFGDVMPTMRGKISSSKKNPTFKSLLRIYFYIKKIKAGCGDNRPLRITNLLSLIMIKS